MKIMRTLEHSEAETNTLTWTTCVKLERNGLNVNKSKIRGNGERIIMRNQQGRAKQGSHPDLL